MAVSVELVQPESSSPYESVFRLVCYNKSPRDQSTEQWEITHNSDLEDISRLLPNDEICSFDLTGDVGMRVEFFNDPQRDRVGETWAEAEITQPGQLIEVDDMNVTAVGYQHHKHPRHDAIRGKVSAINLIVPK